MNFSPTSLGSLSLQNPLVLAPMTTYSGQPNGDASEGELAYIARRAPGYGLVMTAACYVHPSGKAFPGQWGCDSDDRLGSLRAMADVIRKAGSKSCLQIHHGGRQCTTELAGTTPWSASAIPAERPNAETPHAMTESEIETTIEAFAQAAIRAVATGYDSVEIHGANTYLLQQYVSPHSNRREDKWGQDRVLFSELLTQRVLAAVPSGYPVGYRFSPEEIETPGIRWPDTVALLDRLCRLPLAWLHVSLRDFRAASMVGDFDDPTLNRTVQAIAGRMPLIGVGGVTTPAEAHEVLAAGASAVAIARAAITDPDLAPKFLRGESAVTMFPAVDGARKVTVPEGLANRIYGAPGWFVLEEAEEAPSLRS